MEKKIKLFIIIITSLFFISCSLVPSGNTTKITKREGNADSEPLLTPIDNINPSALNTTGEDQPAEVESEFIPPTDNDIQMVWEVINKPDPAKSETDYHILQIWENRRKDYFAERVVFTVSLLGMDSKELKSKSKDYPISAGSSIPIDFSITNDTGSKVDKVVVTAKSVDWKKHDVQYDSPIVSISNPEFPGGGAKLHVKNESDFAISNITTSYLVYSLDGKPLYAFLNGSQNYDKIDFGQSKELLDLWFFPEWATPDSQTYKGDEKYHIKYWIMFKTHTGEPVSYTNELDAIIYTVKESK